jgi:hypothetical protein
MPEGRPRRCAPFAWEPCLQPRTALGSAVGAVYGSRDRRVLHYWTGCRTRSRTSSPTSVAWCTSCGRPNSTSWGRSRRCASTPTGSPNRTCQTGLSGRAHYDRPGASGSCPAAAAVEVAAYRIAAEALTNGARHAWAPTGRGAWRGGGQVVSAATPCRPRRPALSGARSSPAPAGTGTGPLF